MHKLSENTTSLLLLFLSTACLIGALPIVQQNSVPSVVHVDSKTTSLPMVLDLIQDEIGSQDPEEALFEEQLMEQHDQLSPYEVANYQPYVVNRRQKRQSQWALNYARDLAEKKRTKDAELGLTFQPQNWNVELDTPVWQSASGRHAVRATGMYAQSNTDLQGGLLREKDWKVGAGYGWESKNGKHGLGGAVQYGQSHANYLGQSAWSQPSWNAGISYRFRLGG